MITENLAYCLEQGGGLIQKGLLKKVNPALRITKIKMKKTDEEMKDLVLVADILEMVGKIRVDMVGLKTEMLELEGRIREVERENGGKVGNHKFYHDW